MDNYENTVCALNDRATQPKPRKSLPLGTVAVLFLVCVSGLFSCDPSAKPQPAVDDLRSSETQKSNNGKPGHVDQALVPHAARAAGDDIGMGLVRSIRLGKPAAGGFEGSWPANKRAIANRDENLRQLKGFLASRLGLRPIEVFAADVYYCAHGGDEVYKSTVIYYGKDLLDTEVDFMTRLGFMRIGEADWRAMRCWMPDAATRAQFRLGDPSDLEDIVVFSYYDGVRWRIAPWFFLSVLPGYREPTQTDMAIFSLIAYLNRRVQPPISFASHYLGLSLFSDDEIRRTAAENLKQGRPWDYVGQEKSSEAKPEGNSDTVNPRAKGNQ